MGFAIWDAVTFSGLFPRHFVCDEAGNTSVYPGESASGLGSSELTKELNGEEKRRKGVMSALLHKLECRLLSPEIESVFLFSSNAY